MVWFRGPDELRGVVTDGPPARIPDEASRRLLEVLVSGTVRLLGLRRPLRDHGGPLNGDRGGSFGGDSTVGGVG